ncbi:MULTISPECIES: DUF1127 domain-containing protein [Ruegeria]|uniref:DUF1127 domain-containing protein n=1 Tax=Ruegeria TaxID=97050 RepID=UPI00147B08F7|nr:MULTISPECIES: DUF1127 domain-containing protein [Ruegeria]NOE32163.1 DUF1127 domain-containing protein [Ruegeria sp. HKCCD7318]
MAVDTQTVGTNRGHTIAQSISFLAWIGSTANAALKALQMARMLSTLSNMSDYQLSQIGISRSDIPKYAAKLMAD